MIYAFSYNHDEEDEEVQQIIQNFQNQLRRSIYTPKDIKRITDRVSSPARALRDKQSKTESPFLDVDRFGVPPHLWGRQKPASKELIDRLVKPTTSYSQRQALTLRFRQKMQK